MEKISLGSMNGVVIDVKSLSDEVRIVTVYNKESGRKVDAITADSIKMLDEVTVEYSFEGEIKNGKAEGALTVIAKPRIKEEVFGHQPGTYIR